MSERRSQLARWLAATEHEWFNPTCEENDFERLAQLIDQFWIAPSRSASDDGPSPDWRQIACDLVYGFKTGSKDDEDAALAAYNAAEKAEGGASAEQGASPGRAGERDEDSTANEGPTTATPPAPGSADTASLNPEPDVEAKGAEPSTAVDTASPDRALVALGRLMTALRCGDHYLVDDDMREWVLAWPSDDETPPAKAPVGEKPGEPGWGNL